MGILDCDRSRANPCLHYERTLSSVIIWLSWIDDCIYCGKEDEVVKMKEDFTKQLDCEDSGDFNEHVGVKIDEKGNAVKLSQPVLIQSLEDEFEIPPKTSCHLPAPPGKDLLNEGEQLSAADEKICRSGVCKLLFLMRHSRPDILKVVRELSK